MSNEEQTEPKNRVYGSVVVGHSIDCCTDESCVVVGVNHSLARVSVAGARLVAEQLRQWADHAEKRNAEHPARNVASFMYKVIEKGWQPVEPETAAPTAPAAQQPVERVEVPAKVSPKPVQRKPALKRKR